MILTVYADESGTHADSQAITLAGYISTPDRWERFEAEWRAALADFGVGMFHMTDFENRVGEFSDWPEALRRERLSRLVKVIDDHALASFSVAFLRSDYEAVVTPEAHAYVGGPYGMAAVMAMIALGRQMNLIGLYGSLAYVFESGSSGLGQVLKVFTDNMNDPKRRDELHLASISFQDKRWFIPLQAADILAYESYKHLPRQLGVETWERGTRHSLRMLTGVPYDWGYANQEQIRMVSRAATIRAGLSRDQLAPRVAASPYTGAHVAISFEELRDRWRWWLRATGHRQRRMVPA